MSVMVDAETDEFPPDDDGAQDAPTPTPVEVRRNVGLAAGVGGFAALLMLAFAARAFTGGTALDWLAFAVLAVVAVAHLAAVVDARAPLLVADARGVRLREGGTWRGIAWDDIDCLEHLPRRGLLRDGHLLVDGFDGRQLVVPLTLATRLVGASGSTLSDAMAALASGRADVVEVVPGLTDEPPVDGGAEHDLPDAAPDRVDTSETSVLPVTADDGDSEDGQDTGEIPIDPQDLQSTGDLPVVDASSDATDETAGADDTDDTDDGTAPPAPGRDTVLSARVEIERPVTFRDPMTAPGEEKRALEHTSTVVLADLAVPAESPVIGPTIAASRERLRLTIDQVSERTRIRPHVIEAIEVDDFVPCGGDFYARGHLRTLGRVLGIDAAPLVASYDEHYADAPVDPRRVFESELATGSGGPIRTTRGGRNWSALVAAVMGVILVWSVAKLLMDGPQPIGDTPVLNQSGGISKAAAAKGDPVDLTLVAAGGGAQLVIRDAAGEIVFDGNLAFGQTSELDVVPPVRIWTSDGSVTYALDGAKVAPLGETGSEASKTLILR